MLEVPAKLVADGVPPRTFAVPLPAPPVAIVTV
jgi:hypothetical protein